ncbi:MAG: aminotransferase class I/II-fold pyridoxal phosphate-dependent enzyme, partial [Phyllobacteriaceae bacterium]|nr:aminotransferase class I/II-fold pyridoxal phosphate-dependent enzyme [Phyllobacteriaceae bacterium]
PGIRIAAIPGTFYAFPDVSAYLGKKAGNTVIHSSDELCDWLLEEHNVATVPGSAFGAANSIRLSFATSEVELEKALQRIAKGLALLG